MSMNNRCHGAKRRGNPQRGAGFEISQWGPQSEGIAAILASLRLCYKRHLFIDNPVSSCEADLEEEHSYVESS